MVQIIRIAAVAVGLFALMLSFQNCSDVNFRKPAEVKMNTAQGETVSIEKLKPVFAVRAIGCLACHAEFSSKVITDMGHGDSYFLGGNSLSAQHPVTGGTHAFSAESGNPYGVHGTAFDETVLGDGLMVPRAAYPAGRIAGRNHDTLAEYMVSKFQKSNPNLFVEEKNEVYIGAPTADRIRGLLSSSFSKAEYKSSTGDNTLRGFQYHSADDVISNDPTVVNCEGDLIFDATVSLKNLRIHTKNGCRIYSSRSVFIEGPITYVGQTSKSNLQISSAQSIIMGLGKNTCGAKRPHDNAAHAANTLHMRILEIWTSPRHFTRGDGGNPIVVAQDIYNQSLKVETTEAICQPGGDEVAFERILLNAPQIHSRYRGAFQGSVIGEFAIFSLNDFSFSFDPVFSSGVDILPLLEQEEYLSVSEF